MSAAPRSLVPRYSWPNTTSSSTLADHLTDAPTRSAGPDRLSTLPRFDASDPRRRRDRLWELSTNIHCSIIGTCLSTADLRALLNKLGDPSAATASEHELHGQVVSRAGRKEAGGKLLHKLLDRRHERAVARFARVETRDEVRELWRQSVAKGEIPGAYWAVMSHSLTDNALVQEAFGEVHMLSHLVGRSIRSDLRRLVELDAQVETQADVISDQQGRIAALTDEKAALARRLADNRCDPAGLSPAASNDMIDQLRRQDAHVVRLEDQLRRAESHAAAESGRRTEAERALRALAEDIRQGAEREHSLRAERDGLEAAIAATIVDEADPSFHPLSSVTLLYVGGRPRQVAQARLFVEQRGGHLLTHDGGVEDNPLLLPGLVSRSAAALFPVDFVSLDAAGAIKRACRDTGVPFVPMRTASLAAFVAAVTTLG